MAAVSRSVCFQCGKEPQGAETLKKCGRCKSVEYCGKDCQTLSWQTHKLACPILESFLPVPDDNTIVCGFYDPERRQVDRLTQAQFYEKTGIRFIKSNLATPGFVTTHAQKLVSEPPIADCSDSICLTNQKGMGHGVMAIKAIPEGATICPFLGEIQTGEPLDLASSIYRRDAGSGLSTDPSKMGNLAAIINDGPPNCQPVPGLGQRTYVEASRLIQSKEHLYDDYGPEHAIKSGPYRIAEDGLKSMIQYCSKNDPYIPKNLYQHRMTGYMFGTFAAFMKLHLNGTLSAKTTLRQLQNRKNLLFQVSARKGLFARFYPEILKLIAKVERDKNLLEKLDQLGDDITSRSYCQALILLASKDLITEETIAACRQYGRFVDQLYLWSNGTLVGSCLDKPYEPVDDPFPISDLRPIFNELPQDVRNEALECIHANIQFQADRTLNFAIGKRKAEALTQFKMELIQTEEKKS